MNERIRDLMKQATTEESDGFKYFDKELFAELIVAECARVYWNIDNGETHTEYVEALKQHFGVE